MEFRWETAPGRGTRPTVKKALHCVQWPCEHKVPQNHLTIPKSKATCVIFNLAFTSVILGLGKKTWDLKANARI